MKNDGEVCNALARQEHGSRLMHPTGARIRLHLPGGEGIEVVIAELFPIA